MTAALGSLRSWFIVRGVVVTAALAVVIGLVLIGQGPGGLVEGSLAGVFILRG